MTDVEMQAMFDRAADIDRPVGEVQLRDDVLNLVNEARRLRDLVVAAQWKGHEDEWGGYDGETDVLPACPWCERVQPGEEQGHRVHTGHAPDCAAFTSSGEVK